MELGPEDMSLLERCPHFRGWYVQASMELGPEDVSLLERCPHFRGYLSLLQKRNKPTDPPKQLKQAPFFLPTLTGLVPKFITGDNEGDIPDTESAGSKIVNLEKLEPLSEFQRLLEDCSSTEDCKIH